MGLGDRGGTSLCVFSIGIRIAPHQPDRRASGNADFFENTKPEPLVERKIFWLLGFEVRGFDLGVAAFQDWLKKQTAKTLSLMSRFDTEECEIPMGFAWVFVFNCVEERNARATISTCYQRTSTREVDLHFTKR